MTDYAVVVGIARYPQLATDGVAPDLDGPDGDAQAVRDWLVDPDGGGLAASNVRLLRTGAFEPLDPDDPQPTMDRVRTEMLWIERQTRASAGGRLYLYFSGHGFSPVLEEGALLTADATQVSPNYVYAHAWLRWFRRAQRFRESVLWMDCCMDYQQSIPTNEVLMRAELGTGVPGPAFIGLAAQTRSALEHRMADGQVHGVFTWALLNGLRGGAADERGQITGESLRTFLYNVMPEFLPDSARRTATVDLQPFVRADQGIVFRRLPTQPTFRVRLTVPPAAVGAQLRIWADRPYTRVVSAPLTGTEWTGELERGLYVAELPGVRHGFQVSGGGDVDVAVRDPGEPVLAQPGATRFKLHVRADNAAAAITVTDYAFERVFIGTGELHASDKPGVYKVRVEIGRDMARASEQVVLLDRDLTVDHATAGRPPAQAPVTGSAPLSHQRDPFHADARTGALEEPARDRCAMSVLARYGSAPDAPGTAPPPHPMAGLRLVDRAGAVVVDLARESRVEQRSPADPVAVWERELAPGPYFLRLSLPEGRSFEACVVACAGRVTRVALDRARPGPANGAGRAGIRMIEDVAILMPPRGAPARPPDQDAVIEAARLALVQGRNLLGAGRGTHLGDLLLRTYDDPVAGIIGGHLLLRAVEAAEADPGLAGGYDDAVLRLRTMVGAAHPDVEALSLRCADPALRAARPFTVPPLFSHSWHLIAEASYERPELVSLELWQRVHATATLGPYFVWAADEATRAAHAAQLSRWITGYDQAGLPRPAPVADRSFSVAAPAAPDAAALPEAARDAAKRLSLPAAGAGALWESRSAG